MDADWDELTVIPHVGPLPAAHPTPISTLAFDNSQELLWVGSSYGRVVSFYGRDLQKYTSYKGHIQEPVKQILFHEKGVISLSSRSIHLARRTGPAIWHLTNTAFLELQCMSFIAKGSNELLVAGIQDQMFKIDVERGEVIETIAAEDKYTLMKQAGQYICAANCTGVIHILDSVTLRTVRTWQAHSSMVTDMDCRSDFLVTCGLSQRQQHGLMHDPLANVFDLKSLSPLPPIPFQPGAAFVRMHPKMSTTSIVASQTGQLQVVDLMNPHTVNLKQAHIYDNNFVTGLELAPTGEALALASSMCQVHLWGHPSKLKFTEFTHPTIFPDVVTNDTPMDWSEETPLNTIGMPYYRELLLSAWPHSISEVGGIPPKVDPAQVAIMKRGEFGLYGPVLKKPQHPNQVVYTRLEAKNSDHIVPPKFLSEKARDIILPTEEEKGFTEAISSLTDLKIEGPTKKDVPHLYRKQEIKYSRFGIDDFDFSFYNKTSYSGLETHITNSYANPLLQLYRFTSVIRNLALYHTAMSCIKSDCMLCELGFLIDMLEKAVGQNCQASNFLKNFSSLPAVKSLNLLEDHSATSPMTMMIQSVNRFLLDKFLSDFRQISGSTPYMDQALATAVTTTIRCAHCNHEQTKREDPLVHGLIYPQKNVMRHQGRNMPRVTFSQVLKASVERQEHMRGYCLTCRRYQQLHSIRTVRSMPAVFTINADIQSQDAKQLWASPNWLPQEIGIIVDKGQFFCYQDQDLKYHVQRGVFPVQVYELVGVVAEITSGETQKPHLVSLVNVALSDRNTQAVDNWHIFNDFLVQQVPRDEALRFDPAWKLPSVLTYQIRTAAHRIDDSWKEKLDTQLLYTRLYHSSEDSDPVTMLAPDEVPQPGTPVGIDAEFVSLQHEEIEINADGTRETIRPSRLGLARVSVLRGEGPLEDQPFIDDYIAIKDPVVDYLTAFSGIKPGDLDPLKSQHALITLKIAYRKLWLLLNLGCVFVGHGLLKDFRTINIHVPRGQVIDTVDLWFIKARARKLNLRFLAWLLLREDVQSGDAHDSVEDARTAIHLWRKYEEVQANGRTEEMLEWIYKRGRDVGFRAPNSVIQGAPRSDTGRNTPEPGESSGVRTPGTGTPVKRTGLDRAVFGSPLR